MDDHESMPLRSAEVASPGMSADLQTVLDAWRDATLESERANELLQAEVRRLRHQLQSRTAQAVADSESEFVAQIAVDIAQQVRAHLGPTSHCLHLLRTRLRGDRTALAMVQKLESGVAALDEATDDLLQCAALSETEMRTIGLRDVVEEVQDGLATYFTARGVALTIDVPPQVMVWGDYELLRRAVVKLMLNALGAMPSGGEIVVTSYDGPRGVELEIADSGEHSAQVAPLRAFEPSEVGESSGSGLGMAVVQRIAQRHGGDVFAANCPEGGMAFTMRFPPRRMLRAVA